MVSLDFQGKTWVAVGDSRTYGYNADPIASNAWPYLLTNERNAQYVVDNGHPGQFLQIVAGYNCYVPTDTPLPTQNGGSKYLFINYGTNDVKADDQVTFNVADFKAGLISDLEYLNSTKGWAYTQMVLSTINYFTAYGAGSRTRHLAYNAAIQEVASVKNTIFLDLFTHFDSLPNKDLLIDTDGIHETNAGHREVANFFESADYTPVNGFPVIPDPIQSIIVKRGNFTTN